MKGRIKINRSRRRKRKSRRKITSNDLNFLWQSNGFMKIENLMIRMIYIRENIR